jgi:Tol biopolymer transport system component
MKKPMSRIPGLAVSLLLLGLGSAACAPKSGDQEKIPPPAIAQIALKPDFPFRGKIIFQSDADGDDDIYRMTSGRIGKLTANSWSDQYPRWSPDGTRIAFSANPGGRFGIFVMNEDGSGIKAVVDSPSDATEPAWFPDGRALAFTRDDVLWKIDLSTGMESRIFPDFPAAHGLSDFSPAAPLAAFTGSRSPGWDVFAQDLSLSGHRFAALTDGGMSCRPRFSRDGKRIAYVSSIADGKGDIWTMNPDGSDKTRLTERDATSDYYPAWSPDGKYIAFCSSLQHFSNQGRWSLFLVKVESRRVIPLFSGFERILFPDWH